MEIGTNRSGDSQQDVVGTLTLRKKIKTEILDEVVEENGTAKNGMETEESRTQITVSHEKDCQIKIEIERRKVLRERECKKMYLERAQVVSVMFTS